MASDDSEGRGHGLTNKTRSTGLQKTQQQTADDTHGPRTGLRYVGHTLRCGRSHLAQWISTSHFTAGSLGTSTTDRRQAAYARTHTFVLPWNNAEILP